MKLFKTLAMTFLFIVFATQFSIANPMDDPRSDLRIAVTKLLRNPALQLNLEEEVRVSFFVTSDDQLVVLKTDARTKSLDEFIKERMNYHKINIEDLEVNRIFHIKVHFALK